MYRMKRKYRTAHEYCEELRKIFFVRIYIYIAKQNSSAQDQIRLNKEDARTVRIEEKNTAHIPRKREDLMDGGRVNRLGLAPFSF